MANRSHRSSIQRSIPTYAQQTQCAPPPRMSSLHSDLIPPQHPPPPVPLSQMTMEELMQILPRLDAAVIALDWVPCMQKRQQELKTWLQSSSLNPNSGTPPNSLDKDLRKVINESKDVANEYYKLFEIVKDLQNKELQKKDEEFDDVQAQRSEATIALARHVSMHNDKCDQYERELEESRDKASQSIDVLSHFIHQNLDEAMRNAPQEKVEGILHVLVEMKSDTYFSSNHVRSDLYQNLKKALRKSNNERDSFRAICSQQMKTIQDQSKNLDQYIARMANIISVVQEKEHQNQKLREELAQSQQTDQSQKDAAQAQMQQKGQRGQEQSPIDDDKCATPQLDLVNEIWKRDAEVMNLRRKLEKAFEREIELQTQLRVRQSSQTDQTDKQPSRLKQLLTGQQKLNPGIPTLSSMQNLGHSAFTPFHKEKLNIPQPPSPARSGRCSPSLGAFCEPVTNLDHPELPPTCKTHYLEGASPKIPARAREAVRYPQDEIDSAVSSRFYQMPSNIRSSASTPRPQTPKSSSISSFDDISDYQPSCPRFNSDPGILKVSTIFPRSDRFAEDRQPLVNHGRVLSGITEVTEDGGSFKRRGSSVDSTDKRMYLENLHAARALGGLQIG